MDKAKLFSDLHIKGNPLILFNIWDAGSAKIVESSGAKAIATGSMPVAVANGFTDGEKIPLSLAIDNIIRIIATVDLPVSIDLEGGYGTDVGAIKATVEQAVKAGVVGFNFEDQIVGGKGLYDIDQQKKRVAAARTAAGDAVFLNARTDIFLKTKPDTHNDEMIDDALERAKAYEQAGANGFFAPGLADDALIERLCDLCPLPVNIIALPHVPDTKTLTKLGVSRISYGPIGYKRMAAWLETEARAALA